MDAFFFSICRPMVFVGVQVHLTLLSNVYSDRGHGLVGSHGNMTIMASRVHSRYKDRVMHGVLPSLNESYP